MFVVIFKIELNRFKESSKLTESKGQGSQLPIGLQVYSPAWINPLPNPTFKLVEGNLIGNSLFEFGISGLALILNK